MNDLLAVLTDHPGVWLILGAMLTLIGGSGLAVTLAVRRAHRKMLREGAGTRR